MKTKLYLTIFLLSFAVFGYAQPGEIDNSFNLSGIGAYGGNAALPTVNASAGAIVYGSDVYGPLSALKDKIIIIGRFSSYNGVQRKKIARLNADGTLDTSFVTSYFSTDPNTDYIYCIQILQDDKILIGGQFAIGNYRNIARLNSDGSIDTTFNPVSSGSQGTNGEVHALLAPTNYGDKILIGGNFTTYNGSGNRRLIRLNANGSLDNTYNTTGTPNGEVRALAIQRIGSNANKILVGGFFSGFTGYSNKSSLIRVLPNGDFDPTFNVGGTGADGGTSGIGIFEIIVKPVSDSFYAVGKFQKWNGSAINGIVFLKKDAELRMNTIGAGLDQSIFSAKLQPDGKVLLAGNFTTFGGITIPKGITRISEKTVSGVTDIERDVTFITGTGFTGGTGVYEGISVMRDIILQDDGKIIVSGDYTQYNGTSRRMISRIKTRECKFASVFTNGAWKDGIVIDGTTADNYMTITNGTLTIPTGSHFTACELEIQSGGNLIIQPGASLTVNGIVMNNGTFTVENTGSVVQVKEDTKNADLGAGIFTMKRNVSNLKGFDFVYWSSPVEDQMLHDVSPNTRPDKYYKFNTSINNWQIISGGYEKMEEGKGYIARAPAEYLTTNSYTYPAAFIGRPRNGKIQVPIIKAGTSNMNLVGNPYPSAIDASLFLNDVDNKLVIGGTIYLWTHQTGIATVNSGTTYSYASSDYAAYNKVGGTMTNPTGTLFQGKVAAGQGFFLEALSTTNAFFKNTMRVKNNNAQFYKSDATTATQGTSSRLWLNFANDQGAFKQTLIGFTDDSSNGLDRNDGNVMNGNSFVNFYSIVEDKNLVIQGRALPFDNNQVIPLGYSTTIAGNFTISLYQFDGLFSEQNVYLVDKLNNTTQEIKSSGYSFSTTAGTFDNRFEIRFTNGLLNTQNVATTEDTTFMLAQNNTVSIKASASIESITVFDLTGKLLYTKKGIESSAFSTDKLNVQNQIVLVQVNFINHATINKKVLID